MAEDGAPGVDIPSLFMLRAAFLAARVLRGTTSTSSERAAGYWRLPTGGIFSGDDLMIGERLLGAAGFLLSGPGGDVVTASRAAHDLASLPEEEACAVLLIRYLAARQPPWLATALAPDGLRPELLPDTAVRVFDEMALDVGRREAILLATAQHVNSEATAETGAKGENHVVDLARRQLHEAGRPELAVAVRRVSLISDALGYDVVAPNTHAAIRRWEVKTTSAPRRLRVLVSRNEADYGRRDPHWSLVACRTLGETVQLAGWCPHSVLLDRLPADRHPQARWRVVEVDLGVDDLHPGLPP